MCFHFSWIKYLRIKLQGHGPLKSVPEVFPEHFPKVLPHKQHFKSSQLFHILSNIQHYQLFQFSDSSGCVRPLIMVFAWLFPVMIMLKILLMASWPFVYYLEICSILHPFLMQFTELYECFVCPLFDRHLVYASFLPPDGQLHLLLDSITWGAMGILTLKKSTRSFFHGYADHALGQSVLP